MRRAPFGWLIAGLALIPSFPALAAATIPPSAPVADEVDWLAGPAPGVAWLYPARDGAARAATISIVIRHAPDQVIVLGYRAAEALSPMRFEGVQSSPDGTVVVSRWRNLPLATGRNVLEAIVVDSSGQRVTVLTRTLYVPAGPEPGACIWANIGAWTCRRTQPPR